MTFEKAPPQDLVLDFASFQLIRAGQRVKLEKTPMEILALLVRRRGMLVTREEIVRTIWADGVHVDVDAGINTAIRKIRLALDDNSASPRYLETVIGKGYRFVGPIQVVENVLPSVASAPRARPRRRLVVALLAAGLATFLVFLLFAIRHPKPVLSGGTQGRVVVAVAPLENLSGDPRQDYFARGLTEEVITQLGQLKPERIAVVRYAPSMADPQTSSTLGDLSRESELRYLLEGNVQRQDDRARISVRLLRFADKTTIWAESFDRNVGDVLSLQSEIARRVGRELQIQVLTPANRQSVQPAVVESYLRGRFELARHMVSLPDAARAHFERAIALDPSYAPAYAGMADFYRSRAMADDDGAEDAWQLAEQYATHALSLDSDSAETHTAIAEIMLMHDWDWSAAREHVLRALQLNPSLPEAHEVYARYLRITGNMDAAVDQRKQAVALDPFRVDLITQLTLEYFFARDYDGMVASARQALAYDPNNPFAHDALCVGLGRLRRFDESVAECSRSLAVEGHADWATAYLREYHGHGYKAASLWVARKSLNEIQKRPQPDVWDLANAYLLAGRRDEALRILFQGLRIHDPGLLQLRVDPDFDSIRNDPRYAELVRQISFPTN